MAYLTTYRDDGLKLPSHPSVEAGGVTPADMASTLPGEVIYTSANMIIKQLPDGTRLCASRHRFA